MAALPAKSWKPRLLSQPPPHTQCASIGYTIKLITKLYIQYEMNFVLSAIAPETIVAAVAQNTKLNVKLDQFVPAKSVNGLSPHPTSPAKSCPINRL